MKINDLDKADKQELRSIIGTTITGFRYINEDEGTYVLELNDGREIFFSSCGDDMTFTMFDINSKGATK